MVLSGTRPIGVIGSLGNPLLTINMAKLIIKRGADYYPFGVPEWNDEDLKTPLIIPVQDAKVAFFIDKRNIGTFKLKRKLDPIPSGRMEIEFERAPSDLVRGIKSKTSNSSAAKRIYSIYSEAMDIFESALLSAGALKYMYWMRKIAEYEFFGGSFGMDKVTWSLVPGNESGTFQPKIPSSRKINPLYKSNQLMTLRKWQKLQDAIDNNNYPKDELLELYKMRNKAYLFDAKTAAIEASIISEALLRKYGLSVLKIQGYSSSKIKKIKDELTFNNLLNVILPLSLTKTEFTKISSAVNNVDTLRRIRNDLVHGNIDGNSVDQEDVKKGTESAIKLVEFLKSKIEHDS